MVAKLRTNSICTVHFKRLLPLPPTNSATVSPSQTLSNQDGLHNDVAHQDRDPHRPLHPHTIKLLLPADCRSSPSDSTRSFCSEALKASAKLRLLCGGKQVHGLTVKAGLCKFLSLQNQALDVYVKCGQCSDAWRLFEEIPVKNVVTWNTLICGVVSHRCNFRSIFSLVVHSFRRMLAESVVPDFLTFNGLLHACIEFDDIELGRQLHAFVLKHGAAVSCFVGNALVSLYGKSDLIKEMRWAFDDVPYRDSAMWNAMLSSYALTFSAEEAFGAFNSMRTVGLGGDGFTFSSLLSCCATSGQWQLVQQIHSLIIRLALDMDIFVASALVNACAKNGQIDSARKAFDVMPVKNVVSWNTIILGYGHQGNGVEAVKLLREMLDKGFHPNELTLASVVSLCSCMSSTNDIMQLHAQAIKTGYVTFLSILNSLMNAYSQCGNMDTAAKCFSLVPKPDLVTWSTIIRGYGFHGLAEKAVEAFEKMLSCGTRPDKIAFLAIISACTHAGKVSWGLHYFDLMINTYQLVPDPEQYGCLIDLASRAGLLNEAYDILTEMPEVHTDMLGAFIGACKVHGHEKLAIEAGEMLFALEPDKPVNYSLMSNVYASRGKWREVESVREMMRYRCEDKIPGCSWIEVSGDIHAFVSSDKSHPKTPEIYAFLGRELHASICSTYLSL